MNIWGWTGHLFLIAGTLILGLISLNRELKIIAYFQRHLNRIEDSERALRLEEIPRWRLFKRQKVQKQLTQELQELLNKEERSQSVEAENQFWGWTLLFVSAIAFFIYNFDSLISG